MNTTSILRHINAIRCLRILKRSPIMSRSDIARELNLTRTTVGYAIKVLLDADLVHEPSTSPESSRIGRPSVGVSLNAEGAYFVGLDVSTDTLTAVLVDLSMTVVARYTADIGSDPTDISAVADKLAKLANSAIDAAGDHRDRVRGVGISVPGLVSRDGRVAIAPFLGWRNVDLAAILVERLGTDLTLKVCNDAVAVASAVCASAGDADVTDLLMILISEGIGSAMIRQGKVVEGFNGYAGEIGQMVMSSNLTRSAPSFQLSAGQRFFSAFLPKDRPVIDTIGELATSRSLPAGFDKALEDWSGALATGFLNAIWLLDPERISISGVLAPLYRLVAGRVRDHLEKAMDGLRVPPIDVWKYGADGAAIGAAALMREMIFALPELADQGSE